MLNLNQPPLSKDNNIQTLVEIIVIKKRTPDEVLYNMIMRMTYKKDESLETVDMYTKDKHNSRNTQ